MSSHRPSVRRVSECFLKPEWLPQESKHPYYLAHWDLTLLSIQYIQKGLLFRKPSEPEAFGDGHPFVVSLLHRLKKSLSTALFHFYPLTGRLATTTNEHPASISIYVDCVNSPGAKFTHAALDLTISDILLPLHVPSVVQSLFDLDTAVSYDGHTLPLLSIQVTELLDGIFIASSLNHSIGDGTSHWNFFNMWSEIFQSLPPDGDEGVIPISRPPILKRWFPDGYGPIIKLAFTHPFQFIRRFEEPPQLRERIFHLSKESIAELKAKANAECGTKEISSFQALSALVWRSITRARGLPQNEITFCNLVANNRARLEPALCEDYFGNVVQALIVEAKVEELVGRGLGWGAWKLHEAVVQNTGGKLRERVEAWFESPYFARLDQLMSGKRVTMTSSPRFKVYENEFGMGKALAVRSGGGNKFEGKVASYPGWEGGGSIDLEINLLPHNMTNLESDSEFMNAVSSPPHLRHL